MESWSAIMFRACICNMNWDSPPTARELASRRWCDPQTQFKGRTFCHRPSSVDSTRSPTTTRVGRRRRHRQRRDSSLSSVERQEHGYRTLALFVLSSGINQKSCRGWGSTQLLQPGLIGGQVLRRAGDAKGLHRGRQPRTFASIYLFGESTIQKARRR